MPWFVWMGFLTLPVVVGVACTFAANTADDPNGIWTVAVAGGVWLFVAYHLKKHLRERTPTRWVRWWLALAVVGPLVTLFVLSLRHDPGVRRLVRSRLEASEKPDPHGIPAAAPARRVLTWTKTKELVARLQTLAGDFVVKLFTSLPPALWFAALVAVSLWLMLCSPVRCRKNPISRRCPCMIGRKCGRKPMRFGFPFAMSFENAA